MSTILLKIR